MELSEEETKLKKNYNLLNIHEYNAQLALGFQTDCENLLGKFSNCKDYTFKKFAELWQELNFTSIFLDQSFVLMIQTFMEHCYFIVKKFLFSEDKFVQTGALYLLYSLYYKQPIREWVKIRLTYVESEKLNEIVENHQKYTRFEPLFIFSKMRLSQAFLYCALDQQMGLESKFLKRHDLSREVIPTNPSTETVVTKVKTFFEEDPSLILLEETDNEYQDLLRKYQEKSGKVCPFPSKITKDIKRTYSKMFDVDLGDDSEDEDRKEAEHLKSIKDKAMTNVNATYRADRQVITAVDLKKFKSASAAYK